MVDVILRLNMDATAACDLRIPRTSFQARPGVSAKRPGVRREFRASTVAVSICDVNEEQRRA